MSQSRYSQSNHSPSQSRYAVETVVVGAGVVGLACARALAQAGHEVLVLEALDKFGTVISARNSEVIHSGLYYAPGSLKAELCVQGRHALYAYCQERGIAHRNCGKLVVATAADEVDYLESLGANARMNGVHDIELLTARAAQGLEPALQATAALQCPSTGIVDSHALMLSLLADAQARGAQVAYRSPVLAAEITANCIELEVGGQEPAVVEAAFVVNSAGLHAPALASRFKGLPSESVPTPRFCKGNYFSLAGRAPFSRLIYPVPEPGGLGVHLTLDLGGQARFGPDTEWLTVEDADQLDYSVDPDRAQRFYAQIRRYWPGLKDGSLQADYSGVRPKLDHPSGNTKDFIMSGPEAHGVPGLVNLFGIESPGLTSALAIADAVLRRL